MLFLFLFAADAVGCAIATEEPELADGEVGAVCWSELESAVDAGAEVAVDTGPVSALPPPHAARTAATSVRRIIVGSLLFIALPFLVTLHAEVWQSVKSRCA